MAHVRASKKFGDTIFYNTLKLVTLNLTQQSVLNSNTRYYTSSAYLQLLKKMNLNCQKITWEIIFSDPQWQLTP